MEVECFRIWEFTVKASSGLLENNINRTSALPNV